MSVLSKAPNGYRFGRWLACWLWVILAGVGRAVPISTPEPEYLVRSWQMEDGLPDSSVKVILQTRDGYLWLGTDNGLARFDGVQFKTFDSVSTPELRSNRILSLLEDQEGGLWIGSDRGGLTRLFKGRFQTVDLGSQSDARVTALLDDGEGGVLAVLEGKGSVRIEAGKFAITGEPSLPVIGGESPRTEMLASDTDVPIATMLYGRPAIARDRAGRIWAASEQELHSFQDGQWRTEVPEQGITALCAGSEGGIWIAGSGRLRQQHADGAMDDLGLYPWNKGSSIAAVAVMCEDRSGGLWAGTLTNGVLRRSASGDWNHVVTAGPLFQNIISCIVEDSDGAIWIGTEHGGLHRLKRRAVTVLPLPAEASDANVQSVCAALDGRMWIATGGAGVFRYQGGGFTHLGEAEGLTGLHVNVVFEDRQSQLWAGTRDGLFIHDAGRFRQVTELGPMPGWVMCMFEDRAGRLWIGAYGGVGYLASGKVTWFTAKDGLTYPDVRAVTEDAQGNVWVGTVGGGLFRIRDGRIDRCGKAQGLASEMVVALLPDGDGSLWIGTHDAGLVRMKDGNFTSYTTRDGLGHNNAQHLADDPEGNLWIGSSRGLMRLRKADLNAWVPGGGRLLPCQTLTVNDGMFSQLCSGGTQPALAWDASGRLWVPNMKAVAVINPRILAPSAAPRTVVEDLLVDGRVQLPDASGSQRAQLGANYFELRYSALNPATAETIRFRYKLEGWDEEWVEAGMRRVAYYNALPAGDYRFRVMASGRDGVWTEPPQPLVLQVVPRFWQTGWFQFGSALLVTLMVAGVVAYLVRRRMRRKIEHWERRNELEQERVRIAQDIHDELGAGLAQIGLLADLGGDDLADMDEARRSFAGIAERARSTVTALDEIVWAVNPSNDKLTRLADYLCQLAGESFENSRTRCYKDVPAHLPAIVVRADVRHNLTMAVKEALTNTLRHSQASEVWLHLAWNDPELVVVVKDDGCGFDPGKVSDLSNGLGNQQLRLAKIGGTVTLESQPGKGTRTSFRMTLSA